VQNTAYLNQLRTSEKAFKAWVLAIPVHLPDHDLTLTSFKVPKTDLPNAGRSCAHITGRINTRETGKASQGQADTTTTHAGRGE
jgi:hypothetical protein